MIDHRAPSFASLPWVEKVIPGFFFALLARFLHEGARNFLPPSLSELALALGAVCLLPPLSPHATCDDGDGDDDDDGGDDDDGDGDGDDDGGDDLYNTLMWRLSVTCHLLSSSNFFP